MARRSRLLPAALVTVLACGVAASGCSEGPPPGPSIEFDPCQPLVLVPDTGATSEQAAGIASGIALWQNLARFKLELGQKLAEAGGPADAPPTLPIVFQTAAAPFHGYYDGPNAIVYINNDLRDHAQAVVVAHEVGHAFGLVHVPSGERTSVMNPGNVSIEPTLADIDTLEKRWGHCE